MNDPKHPCCDAHSFWHVCILCSKRNRNLSGCEAVCVLLGRKEVVISELGWNSTVVVQYMVFSTSPSTFTTVQTMYTDIVFSCTLFLGNGNFILRKKYKLPHQIYISHSISPFNHLLSWKSFLINGGCCFLEGKGDFELFPKPSYWNKWITLKVHFKSMWLKWKHLR